MLESHVSVTNMTPLLALCQVEKEVIWKKRPQAMRWSVLCVLLQSLNVDCHHIVSLGAIKVQCLNTISHLVDMW